MTTKALQLAKGCGASCGVRTTTLRNADLETFYARAQAQALREAAETLEYGPATSRMQLLARAAELEKGT